MKNEIVFCIPSYKRGDKPLLTLKHIPNALVFVDTSEAERYRETNKGAEIIAVPSGVQGNLCRIRNYILDYCFNKEAYAVVIMDDDINCFYKVGENDKHSLKFNKIAGDEFMFVVQTIANIADNVGAKMFGLNPNSSDGLSFRETQPFTFINYIGGPFQGFLNNTIRYDERLSLKEDYDMTLQHLLKYRRVVRCEFVRYLAKMHENKGGCAEMRDVDVENEQFNLLQRKWGKNIVRRDKSSKGHDINPLLKIPLKLY